MYLSYRRICPLYSRYKTYCPTYVRTTLVHTGTSVTFIPDTKRTVQHVYVQPWYMLRGVSGQGSHIWYIPVGARFERDKLIGHHLSQPTPKTPTTSTCAEAKEVPARAQLTGNNYRSSVAAVVRIHIRPLAVASISMEHVHLQMEG